MKTREEEAIPHWRFWLGAFVGFIFLMWALSPVLLPFVIGLALAYFLDPIVDRLEAVGASRWLGAIAALVVFICAFSMLFVLVAPLVQQQLTTLLEEFPKYINAFKEVVIPWLQDTLGRYAPNAIKQIQAEAGNYAGNVASVAGDVVKSVVSGGRAVFDTIALLVVTPVVAFYMLRDWDRMVAALDKALPRQYVKTIRGEMRKVDETLAGFLRGQAMVCLFLAAYYAIALSVVGLDFGVTIGLMAGVLSFIPYVGTISGFIASTGLAIAQFNDATMVGIVIAIYVIGQAVEGNVLAPKLVGDRVGLHPVWVIFALMAGGSLFGFLGVLVALPVAAVIGVLVRFMMKQYLNSKYYKAE